MSQEQGTDTREPKRPIVLDLVEEEGDPEHALLSDDPFCSKTSLEHCLRRLRDRDVRRQTDNDDNTVVDMLAFSTANCHCAFL